MSAFSALFQFYLNIIYFYFMYMYFLLSFYPTGSLHIYYGFQFVRFPSMRMSGSPFLVPSHHGSFPFSCVSNSNVLVFVLSYFTIIIVSNERQKKGEPGWDGRWGGSWRSRRRRNHDQNIIYKKKVIFYKWGKKSKVRNKTMKQKLQPT